MHRDLNIDRVTRAVPKRRELTGAGPTDPGPQFLSATSAAECGEWHQQPQYTARVNGKVNMKNQNTLMTIITWEYWEERASISRAEMRLSGGPHRLAWRGTVTCWGHVTTNSRFDALLMESNATSDNRCQRSECRETSFCFVFFVGS